LKTKNFSIRKNFFSSLKFIKECKNFIYISFSLFFLFSLIGFFIPIPEEISSQLLELIKELLKQTEDLSSLGLTQFIFLNNLQGSFFGMIFGAFFGIFPILALVFNGYLLGFVASISVREEGILILWRLLPHGIFELPAIFISLGLGLKISTFVLEKNKLKSFKDYLKKSIMVFLFVVIPLLIIAAIIEGSLIALSR
jgi:stage II sporulation protein M|tara:strand:+ start:1684 stop:2274 length:591 start_codon:yes stop_codon:yes gene_type:complete